MAEDTIYLTSRCWIPADFVDERDVEELFLHHQFAEHICKRCPIRYKRPSKACYTCNGFEGSTRLYSKRQTSTGVYIGVPLAQWRKAAEILEVDDLPVEDHRKRIKFPQDLQFTGRLYDGSQPDTINQERVVDLFWKRVIETKKNFGVIEAAARSGKTAIAADIICELGFRTFITCSEIAWLEQFLDIFIELTNVKLLHEAIYLISSKTSSRKYKDIPGIKIVSSMDKVPDHACIVMAPYQYFIHDTKRVVQTLQQKFTTLVVDEAHQGAAFSFTKVLSNLDVTFGIALSATVDRNDGMSPIIRRTLGAVAVRIDAAIYPPKFTIVETDVKANGQNPTSRVTALSRSQKRNKIILKYIFDDLRKHENNCLLIPVSRLNHMTVLTKMINEQANFENHVERERLRKLGKVPKDIWPFPLAMTYSGATRDHKAVRDMATKRDIRVVVAYIKKVSHGLSVSSWNIVYTGLAPISNGPGFYQLISRVSTPPKKGEKKTQPIVRHFVDATSDSAKTFDKLWFSRYKSIDSLISNGKLIISDATLERCREIISRCESYSGTKEVTAPRKRVNTLGGFRGIAKRR